MSLRRLNVFLSSTGKDLADHRKAIFTHLRAADAFHVEHSETFGARGTMLDAVHQRLRDCDVLVGIIGQYRGWEPDGDNTQRSITEMEYDWAVEHGLDRLMYVLPDGAVTVPEMSPEVESRQQAFRVRVLANELSDTRVHKGQFVAPSELAAAVITGLQNLLYGRMLKAIRGTEAAGRPIAHDPAARLAPSAPSPEAALAALAADPDFAPLFADPGKLDIDAITRAVSHRAATRVATAENELKAAESQRKLAAKLHSLKDLVRDPDIPVLLSSLLEPDLRRLTHAIAVRKKLRAANECHISYAHATGDSESAVRSKFFEDVKSRIRQLGLDPVTDEAIGHNGNIEWFKDEIASGRRIVIILSDKYLRSDYCIEELIAVYEDCRKRPAEFRRRVRIVRLPGTQIWPTTTWPAITEHWTMAADKLFSHVQKIGTVRASPAILESAQRYNEYAQMLPEIFALISKTVHVTSSEEIALLSFETADD